MNKIIDLQNVSKSYKKGGSLTHALIDINLSLKEHESMSIIGPSGSGKSTLLNIIGGLEKPDKGKAIIAGQDISKLSDRKLSEFRGRTIGFIFQFFNLQEYLDAQNNVMIPMLFSGVKRDEAAIKALELLEKVHLKKRAHHYPNQLSGGELQRVAIARSLANDPKLLLADEPTANLDRKSANVVLELFEEISANGVSIVVITHDPYVSSRFKNIVHISDGKIIPA